MVIRKPTPALSGFVCTACRHQQRLQRSFTTAAVLQADEQDPFAGLLATTNNNSPAKSKPRRPLAPASSGPRAPGSSTQGSGAGASAILDILNSGEDAGTIWKESASEHLNDRGITSQAHTLHVYSTKHNTHVTLVQPAKPAAQTISSSVSSTSTSAADRNKMVDVLLSLSTGNIGFRKGGRGEYDAAYQLGAFVMKQIQEKGMLRDIRSLEVVLRGFGAGREALTKILLGTEGRLLRSRITAVTDATRLKFGGDRSPKPRRLG